MKKGLYIESENLFGNFSKLKNVGTFEMSKNIFCEGKTVLKEQPDHWGGYLGTIAIMWHVYNKIILT